MDHHLSQRHTHINFACIKLLEALYLLSKQLINEFECLCQLE